MYDQIVDAPMLDPTTVTSCTPDISGIYKKLTDYVLKGKRYETMPYLKV